MLTVIFSLGMQDDHRLSTSELEKKYGTSIDKVSPQGFLKELPPGTSGLPRAPQSRNFIIRCVWVPALMLPVKPKPARQQALAWTESGVSFEIKNGTSGFCTRTSFSLKLFCDLLISPQFTLHNL